MALLRTRLPVPRPRARVLCVPYAGGGATVYHAWPPAFPADVEVVAVQLPARQDRLLEPGLTRVADIVTVLAAALDRLPPAPLVVYGHSFGAVVAFELARSRPVAHLVVGARRAPSHAAPHRIAELPDGELLSVLHRHYGAPAAVLQSPALAELVLPPIRADFRALEAYVCDEGARIDAPITALSGRFDPMVDAEGVEAWAAHTRGAFTHHAADAGHFFCESHRDWVIGRVRGVLA